MLRLWRRKVAGDVLRLLEQRTGRAHGWTAAEVLGVDTDVLGLLPRERGGACGGPSSGVCPRRRWPRCGLCSASPSPRLTRGPRTRRGSSCAGRAPRRPTSAGDLLREAVRLAGALPPGERPWARCGGSPGPAWPRRCPGTSRRTPAGALPVPAPWSEALAAFEAVDARLRLRAERAEPAAPLSRPRSRSAGGRGPRARGRWKRLATGRSAVRGQQWHGRPDCGRYP